MMPAIKAIVVEFEGGSTATFSGKEALLEKALNVLVNYEAMDLIAVKHHTNECGCHQQKAAIAKPYGCNKTPRP
jgi:hypothetical protein